MQIGHRAERGFPDRSGVERPGDPGAHRVLVRGGGLRHDVVGMLPVRDDATPVGLGDLEQLRISARGDRPRFGAHHRAEPERPARGRTPRHRHQPVDAAELAALEGRLLARMGVLEGGLIGRIGTVEGRLTRLTVLLWVTLVATLLGVLRLT